MCFSPPPKEFTPQERTHIQKFLTISPKSVLCCFLESSYVRQLVTAILRQFPFIALSCVNCIDLLSGGRSFALLCIIFPYKA